MKPFKPGYIKETVAFMPGRPITRAMLDEAMQKAGLCVRDPRATQQAEMIRQFERDHRGVLEHDEHVIRAASALDGV